MKKLYYGAYEYIETNENLGSNEKYDLINKHRNDGYVFVNFTDGTPAIYYDGVLYKLGNKYREYTSVGEKLHDLR